MDFSGSIFSRGFCLSECFSAPVASALLLALSLCPAGPALSQQPSFNCAADRHPDEVTICGSLALAGLDRRMNDLYFAARERLDLVQQSTLQNSQRYWLRQRAACERDANCISRLYQQRILELSALAGSQSEPSAPVTPQFVEPYAPPPAPYMPPEPVKRPSQAAGEDAAGKAAGQGSKGACDGVPNCN
jgi:uncharacterized protein YecT (DUF1311 family)